VASRREESENCKSVTKIWRHLTIGVKQSVLFLKVFTNLPSKEKNGTNVPQMLSSSNIFYLV